ncbi:hypothetical protein U9Z62_16030 [Escherichia coli]|nr:hypothetical protein [Salmonella enterica]EBV5349193.1 hypothetical protein [Salmonella enterica subsp. enterica serovar Stanley]EED5260341.1 hypothetical protein [Salmonella enterica subsp. enterica serovar Senftenberg]MDZ9730568.1 hypothetical protein [Escherichia coli]EGZ9134010.1 hypothetical protein [Salmonella enterica]MDQ7622226.1 hypothetical protein [Salmonella enterica subsp. enterica serovar Agona]
MHGFACVFLPYFLQITPRPTRRERVSATALKPPCKAGGRGGESTARIVSNARDELGRGGISRRQ